LTPLYTEHNIETLKDMEVWHYTPIKQHCAVTTRVVSVCSRWQNSNFVLL